jgi:hypothetical protein
MPGQGGVGAIRQHQVGLQICQNVVEPGCRHRRIHHAVNLSCLQRAEHGGYACRAVAVQQCNRAAWFASGQRPRNLV